MEHTTAVYAALGARFAEGAEASEQSDLARAFADFLFEELPGLWCAAYRLMPGSGDEIVQLTDENYEFLFDISCERVVAAFGVSRHNPADRDRLRMRGFLGRTTSERQLDALTAEQRRLAGLSWRDRYFETHGEEYDRGHFISHRQGGGLDINLFPQLGSVNRGRSPDGVAYRAMEQACASRAGTFCFSRPIYDDTTWVPWRLEYGVISGPHEMDVRTFPNKPEADREGDT